MSDENEILEALYNACHGSNSIIQSNAMKYLHSLESYYPSSGSSTSLIYIYFSIISSSSFLTDDCRLLAIINLKNFIQTYWIQRDQNSSEERITINEKNYLKNNIFHLLSESNMKISLQLSLLIAIIAKYEWSNGQWNNLFPVLFQLIHQNSHRGPTEEGGEEEVEEEGQYSSSSSSNFITRIQSKKWITLTNTIQTLLQIILCFSHRKLIKNKQEFYKISIELIQPLINKWNDYNIEFLSYNFINIQNNYLRICYYNALGNHLCTLTRIIQILYLQIFKYIHTPPPPPSTSSGRDNEDHTLHTGNTIIFSNNFLNSIGEYLYKYNELLANIPQIILENNNHNIQQQPSFDSNSMNYIKFIFHNVELGSVGSDIWSSITSWNDGSDPIDAGLPTTGDICYQYGLNTIDIHGTILSSNLQRYPKSICELMIQISLTISRVTMSIAVIPYFLQRECSTLNEMESMVSPYLSLFYSLLRNQFPKYSSNTSSSTSTSIPINIYSPHCVCEPLALVYTLFISNMLTSFTITDLNDSNIMNFHQHTTVKQFFSLPEEGYRNKLSALFSLLTNHLLPHSKYYFDLWIIDSEELYLLLQSCHEGDSLRLASEGLFSSMMTFSMDEISYELSQIIQHIDRQEILSIDLINFIENSKTITEKDYLEFQQELLYWEGIYTCTGLTPYYLSQKFDTISLWLTNVIGPLLTSLHQIGINDNEKSKNSNYPIYYLLQSLIYRTMWLISCWIHALDTHVLNQVISLLVLFLQPNNQYITTTTSTATTTSSSSPFDILVRLQVIQTLEIIIHSSNFHTQMLLPVIENLFYGLCHMIRKDLNDPHAQSNIIKLFQEIIQSFQFISSNFLLTLVNYLLPLYFLDDTGDTSTSTTTLTSSYGDDTSSAIDAYGQDKEISSNVLRIQLLELFTTILNSLYNPYFLPSSSSSGIDIENDDRNLITNYHEIHHLFLSVIHHSTLITSNTTHLISYGMILWSTLLRNTIYLPNLSQSIQQKLQLDEIFINNIIPIFNNDFIGIEYEEMKIFFSILESYILLGGINMILSSYSRDIFSYIFTHLIGELRPRIICYAIRPIECLLLLQCYIDQLHEQDDDSTSTSSGNNNNIDTNSFHYLMNGPHILSNTEHASASSSSSSLCCEYLSSIGLLKTMLRTCCSVFISINHQHEHYNILYQRINDILQSYQEADIAIISYMSILCRIYLLSPYLLYTTCQELAYDLNQESLIEITGEFLLKSFFHLVINKFDGIGYHRGGIWHRRICCYALLSLYPSQDMEILQMLPDILYLVDDILSENMTPEGQKKLLKLSKTYLSVLEYDEEYEDDQEEEQGEGHSNLKKKETIQYLFEELLQSDPVIRSSFHQYVIQKLNEITQVIPQEELNREILHEMDPSVITRIMMNDYEMIEP